MALFIVWLWLYGFAILANLESLFSDTILVISASAVALVAVALMVTWQARSDRKSGKPTIV